jgi:hypothetical protein
VCLGVRHRARLEPAVEHLADSLQRWLPGSSRRDSHLKFNVEGTIVNKITHNILL